MSSKALLAVSSDHGARKRVSQAWRRALVLGGMLLLLPACQRAPDHVAPSRLVPNQIAPKSAQATDLLQDLQTQYVATHEEKKPRVYHFGSQGPVAEFANHHNHSNRLVPVYIFGRKADLGAVTGENSRYRNAEKIKEAYGVVPPNTVNPRAVYADQSDLYRVQKEAIARGVKHVFIVWFDGLDWPTTQAAVVLKTGKVYTEGKGSGLFFQDYTGSGVAQYGFVVTSPTHDRSNQDIDRQVVTIPADSLRGGYDAQIAGPNPWTPGPLASQAPGYLKGQCADAEDRAGVESAGRVLHAFTDSSQSAGELVSGVKSYNSGLNIADDSRLVTTLFHELQDQGWKVGTVTSVPFCHASPAGMYAQNVERYDYQDIARAMLGLPGIIQEARQGRLHPGLDVVIGTGFGIEAKPEELEDQGRNVVPGNLFLTDADFASIDVKNGGKYLCVHTEIGTAGGPALRAAAAQAVQKGTRLFGFFGAKNFDHLPFRTADGRYDPAPSINKKQRPDRRLKTRRIPQVIPDFLAHCRVIDKKTGEPADAEKYTPAELASQPTLAQMAEAAIDVLSSGNHPFILFVEAGDVDFALHGNNLDNAIGAIYSGEEAVVSVVRWVETHSNWDDSLLIVSSDHGHYLVLDDPQALAGRK